MREGKKVLSALHTLCSTCNMTSCPVHVTKPRSQTHNFLQIMKSRAVFRQFYDRLYSNMCGVLVFSLTMVLSFART